MNQIHYINPRTGKERTIKVGQYSHEFIQKWWHQNPFTRGSRRPLMREADDLMLREGFTRRNSRAGREALRLKKLKNQLADNAALTSSPLR